MSSSSMVSGIPEPFTFKTNEDYQSRVCNTHTRFPFSQVPLYWAFNLDGGYVEDFHGGLDISIMYYRFLDRATDSSGQYVSPVNRHTRLYMPKDTFDEAALTLTWDGKALTFSASKSPFQSQGDNTDWSIWSMTATPILDMGKTMWLERILYTHLYPPSIALIDSLPLPLCALSEVSHRWNRSWYWNPARTLVHEFMVELQNLTPVQAEMLAGLGPEWENSPSSLLETVKRI